MNTAQRITKNIGVLFISQLVSYVLGFFTLIYTARFLGVDGFGILSLALAFTGIFSVCMDLGLSTLTIREVARNKSLAKKFVANISFIKILLSIFTLLIIGVVVQLIGYNEQTIQVIYIIALYTIFTTFSQLFYAVFQANEKMEYQAIGVILNSVLLLVGVFIAIYFKFNITQFSLIYLFCGLSIFCYSIISYSKKFSLTVPIFKIPYWKELLKESWPFAITTISINIYTWIDTILLSIIVGTAAVGLYNASYKLVLVLIVIPVIFNNAVYPLMSQYYISSRSSLSLIFEKLFKIMIITALPIGVGTVLIAKKVIMLIYGPDFLGAVIAMQILIWSIVLIFIRSPFERVLESSNRQLTVTKIFSIGVIFNVIMNSILIPRYSYVGASIITVLTDTLVLALLIIATKNMELLIAKSLKINLLKIIVANIVLAILLEFFLNLNIFLIIIIGIIIYISTILILKIFDEKEKVIIKTILE